MKLFGKALLNTIRSGTAEEMYRSVTNSALYLATGGFLEEANRMLSALWQYRLPHDRNIWLADRALEVLWYAAGTRPPYVPFEPIPMDQLEVEYRKYVGGEHYVYPMPQVDWQELEGKNAFRQAQTWFANLEQDSNTLYLLEKALQQPNELAPYEFCSATAMAAEIAALQGNKSLAIKMAQWWAEKYPEFHLNYNFPIMGRNRHVAPLLLKGILADNLGLSKEICQRIVEEVIVAIGDRMQMGRALVYGDWSWDKLLRKLSELALAFDGEGFSKEEQHTQWIGREKAAEENIATTERRLKLTLPDDYKDFLRASNGLSAFPFCNPQLMPVEDIDWYKLIEEKELYDITKTYTDEESEDGTIEPYTERALLISCTPDEQMVWLIPPIEEADDWQTWFFASWVPGEERYPSFRYFIEKCVLKLEEQGSLSL